MFVLFDAEVSCILWELNREMTKEIRSLNLKAVMGNAGNIPECFGLIDAIERSHLRKFSGE